MTKKEKELGELTYEERYNKDAMADRKELEEQLMKMPELETQEDLIDTEYQRGWNDAKEQQAEKCKVDYTIKKLEKIAERIVERNKYNDWSPSSFLSEQRDEIKKIIENLKK